MAHRDRSFEEVLGSIVRSEVEGVLRHLRLPGFEKSERKESELLTVGAAAALASVSKGTVRNWLKGGRLVRYGCGRLVRVRREELLSLLAGGRPEKSKLSTEDLAAKILSK